MAQTAFLLGTHALGLKGREVFETVCPSVCLFGTGDMYLKELLGSNARVGYCIPVLDFCLVFHGIRCRRKHYNGLIENQQTKLTWFPHHKQSFEALVNNKLF